MAMGGGIFFFFLFFNLPGLTLTFYHLSLSIIKCIHINVKKKKKKNGVMVGGGGGVSVKLGPCLQRGKHLKEAFWWFDFSYNLSISISPLFIFFPFFFKQQKRMTVLAFVYKMQNTT